MCRFTSTELSYFNDTPEHILQHPRCKEILKRFLVECRRRNEQKVVRLWEEIDADRTGTMNDTMKELIDEIDGIPMTDLCEEVEANRMKFYKICCVNILNAKVHHRFMEYLHRYYRR